MQIEFPAVSQIPQLRNLWKDAFGDEDAFLDLFYQTAFHESRCRCVLLESCIAAALYWFDCSLGNEKIAYIYGVATHSAHRGKGLCGALMEDTHALLTRQGYSSVLLVPQQESLRRFYERFGYRDCTRVTEFSCTAAEKPVSLTAVGPEEYSVLRRGLLPAAGVVQEGENLLFLQNQAEFFAGADFLLAAYREKETLHGLELLGNRKAAPGILRSLGCTWGSFRTPGDAKAFSMFLPLVDYARIPEYFGFAFD